MYVRLLELHDAPDSPLGKSEVHLQVSPTPNLQANILFLTRNLVLWLLSLE